MRFIPSYAFGSGLINLGSRKLYSTIEGRDEDYEVFDWNICSGDILMLGLTGLLYYIGIFVVEFLNTKGILTRFLSKE